MWFYSFLKRRNPSVQQPENTTIARTKEFNRESVNKVKLSGVDANRIHNVDESGFSTVQKKNSEIIG